VSNSGVADCTAAGEGLGVQCFINATWPHLESEVKDFEVPDQALNISDSDCKTFIDGVREYRCNADLNIIAEPEGESVAIDLVWRVRAAALKAPTDWSPWLPATMNARPLSATCTSSSSCTETRGRWLKCRTPRKRGAPASASAPRMSCDGLVEGP
jgi:hypothetical protein